MNVGLHDLVKFGIVWQNCRVNFTLVIMNISHLYQLLIFTIFLQSTCSIIITSVYAGRKKFKTFSFDFLLPPIVLEKANKLGFSFNGHWRLQKPNFKIKFNMPLKFPIHMNYANNYDEIDESGAPPASDYNGLGMPDSSSYENDGSPSEANGNGEYNQQYQSAEAENGNEGNDNGDRLPEYNDKPKMKGPIITLHGKLPEDMKNEPIYQSSNNLPSGADKIPYTGKAQVSSFIDNGQFINAHQTNIVMKNNEPPKNGDGLVDEAFEDQLEGAYGKTGASSPSIVPNERESASTKGDTGNQSDEGSRREDIRRSKIVGPLMVAKKVKMLKIPLYAKKLALNDYSKIHTVRLGYKGAPAESSFLTQFEATPDAVPLSLPRSKYSNYYSSLSFTNGLHGIPYEPVGFGPLGTLKWISRMFNKPGIVVPPVQYKLPSKHISLG